MKKFVIFLVALATLAFCGGVWAGDASSHWMTSSDTLTKRAFAEKVVKQRMMGPCGDGWDRTCVKDSLGAVCYERAGYHSWYCRGEYREKLAWTTIRCRAYTATLSNYTVHVTHDYVNRYRDTCHD